MCAEATRPGVRYERGRLIDSQHRAAAEENEPPDIRTFRVIRDIGNSIHPSIQLKIDVPSMNADRKLPILDLKMWIQTIEKEGTMERKIVYEHYIKDVASRYVIERDSAIAISSKRTILTQMCLRAMLNCSHHLGWETRREHVEYFMKRMQASGYDEAFRLQVLKSAHQAYTKICGDEGKPTHRSKAENTPMRRSETKKKRRNWYRKGGYESVLFLPATPRSELKKLVEEEIGRTNCKIKVVERSGKKVKRLLQKNDPFHRQRCES